MNKEDKTIIASLLFVGVVLVFVGYMLGINHMNEQAKQWQCQTVNVQEVQLCKPRK